MAQTIDFWVLALCSTILLRKFSGNTQSQQKVTQQQHKNCFKELLFFTLCVCVCVLGSVFVCVWVCLVWCAHLSNFYALFLCAVRNVRVCEWLWRVPKLVKREWLPLLPLKPLATELLVCRTLRQMSSACAGQEYCPKSWPTWATFVVSNQPNGRHQSNYWAITSWVCGWKEAEGNVEAEWEGGGVFTKIAR